MIIFIKLLKRTKIPLKILEKIGLMDITTIYEIILFRCLTSLNKNMGCSSGKSGKTKESVINTKQTPEVKGINNNEGLTNSRPVENSDLRIIKLQKIPSPIKVTEKPSKITEIDNKNENSSKMSLVQQKSSPCKEEVSIEDSEEKSAIRNKAASLNKILISEEKSPEKLSNSESAEFNLDD